MRINASKTKVTPARIPGEQLDDEPLEDDDKFKYLGLMFVAKGQGTEEIRPELALFFDIRPTRYWEEMMVAYQDTCMRNFDGHTTSLFFFKGGN